MDYQYNPFLKVLLYCLTRLQLLFSMYFVRTEYQVPNVYTVPIYGYIQYILYILGIPIYLYIIWYTPAGKDLSKH